MAMAGMPGGGRRYSEDTLRIALFFGAVLVAIFFALVIRNHFDQDAEPVKGPVRGSPASRFFGPRER